MRHPLLRILVALFVGVWSPLCCCQAALLAGTSCPTDGSARTSHSNDESPAERPLCCSKEGCGQQRGVEAGRSADPESGPFDGHTPTDRPECPSCPACRGDAAGSGLLNAEPKPERHSESESPGFVNAVALATGLKFECTLGAGGGWGVRLRDGALAHLHTNRDAQRWHCALVI